MAKDIIPLDIRFGILYAVYKKSILSVFELKFMLNHANISVCKENIYQVNTQIILSGRWIRRHYFYKRKVF